MMEILIQFTDAWQSSDGRFRHPTKFIAVNHKKTCPKRSVKLLTVYTRGHDDNVEEERHYNQNIEGLEGIS